MLEGRGPGLVLKQDGPWVRSVSGSQGLCSWGEYGNGGSTKYKSRSRWFSGGADGRETMD